MADGPAFRAAFASAAPGLDPRAAWSIATDAIDRFGDGDAGAQTRYVVRSIALARWAREVGLEALPEVIAAISEHPEVGLDALIAMATDPELDRARVLADLEPYWKHSAVLRVPALAAQAMQALAPDATPEQLGAPPAIAKVWEQARLTEPKIVETLVGHGLIEASHVLPPSTALARLVGPSLVFDVLVRAGVAASFDAESGMAEVPYRELFIETLVPLMKHLGEVEVVVTTTSLPNDSFRYELSLAAGAARVATTLDSRSDYFDVERIVQMTNELFAQSSSPSRVHPLRTGDQTVVLLCAPPKVARALAKELGFSLARRTPV